MIRNLRLIFIFTIFSYSVQSQSIDTSQVPVWIEMMQDQNANFFETQKAFELYWENRVHQRGDGWKVFKRWEHHMKDLVSENGTKPSPDQIKTAYDQWRISYNQNQYGAESVGGDWVEIGPLDKPQNGTGQPNGNGRLNAICFHPTNANIIWVGAPAGGLWKTTNGGSTWTSNTDAMATLGVSSILIDPTNTNIMYIGTGDRDAGDAAGLGVYKSTDGGSTWSTANSGMGNSTVGAMIMNPSNSSIILAATSGGVYRTANAGGTWSLTSSNFNFKDIKFKPGDPSIVYATETTSGANFFKSTDGGQSWTQITSGVPTNSQRLCIGVSANDASVVYLLSSVSSVYGGVFKSTDSGNSFTTQSTTPNLLDYSENGSGTSGQGWYDLCIEVDPSNASIVYVGGVNIWKSTNSGVSWDCAAHWVGSSTAASVHADQHWLAFNPVNSTLYACNDGGLYYTTNGGTTWPELSAGLGIAQIYKIGVSEQTYDFVINGYQDNGTAIWDDTIFRTERGGDGMECVIDPTDDNFVYATVYFGNIVRSMDRGYNFGSFAADGTNGINESGAWVTPFILDREDPNVMFIGYKNVWRTTTAKAASLTFTPISNNLAGSNSQNMRQLRQSKVNSNRLFAIRGDNKLFRSDNALASSPTWTDLTSALPGSGTVYDIETHPMDNNTVWLTRGTGVWKSTNAGATWTNITGTLPSINKLTLVADKYSNNGLYVGTPAGVYYIDNSLSNWVAFDDGLPANVRVTELEIYHEMGNWVGSRLRAGTYGRGLWESDLYDPGNIAPLPFVDLSTDSIDICGTDTITLYNNSAYGVTSSLWTITPSTFVQFVNGTNGSSMNPQILISAPGSYDVKLVVSNSAGSDSILLQDAIHVGAGITLPFADDLEDNTLCGASTCNLNCQTNIWRNIKNGAGDNIDWRPDNQGTPWSTANYSSGGNTGPSIDYNPGTSNGKYFYISSYPPYSSCYNKIGILESPCISLDSVTLPEFKFAYHRFGYGPSMGDLDVDVLTNGSWVNLWDQSGNQGDQWLVDSVSLSSYIGQSVKLRFVGHSGSGWQADIAIDGIVITAAPMAAFGVSDTLPCPSDVVIFSDLSTQTATSWQWSISPNTLSYVNGTSATSQNPQVSFNAEGNYQIMLVASNAYGSDVESKQNYIQVAVPEVTLLSSGNEGNFCLGDSILFSVVENLSNYAFYVNGSLIQNGSDSSIDLSNAVSGTSVYVTGSNASGCESNSETIIITIHDLPSIGLSCSDSDLEICAGDSVSFSTNGLNTGLFDFSLNGTMVQSDSSGIWWTTSLTDGDQVWVLATDENLCQDNSDTIQMVVLPLPPTPLIIEGFDSLYTGSIAQLYQWTFDLQDTTTNVGSIEKGSIEQCILRIFDGKCWSLWSDVLIITGFEDILSMKVRAYPNPANESIQLVFVPASVGVNVEITLVDINGRIVNRATETLSKSGTTVMVDLKSVSDGVYTIVLSINGKTQTIPIVKERR